MQMGTSHTVRSLIYFVEQLTMFYIIIVNKILFVIIIIIIIII